MKTEELVKADVPAIRGEFEAIKKSFQKIMVLAQDKFSLKDIEVINEIQALHNKFDRRIDELNKRQNKS